MAGVDDPHKILRSSGELGQNIAARIHRELANLENDAVKSAKPTPYAADVIEHAKWVGAKVAVVSNNDQSAVTSYLVASGLSSVIDCVSARSSADPALMKPSPYLVNEALSALGAERASSALVGDQVSDIIAAHQANIPAIGYANRTGKVKSFADSGADAVIESMSELREFL
jgi:phosphoglycolate phosphatase-like HAD superfamily hydrolase